MIQANGDQAPSFMLNDCDARKLFKFIDYNEARVISKHQIRLLILYYKDFHKIGDPK